MSLEQQFVTGGDRQDHPPCPKCERRMSVRTSIPALFAGASEEVTYRCELCDTDVKRSVKRT